MLGKAILQESRLLKAEYNIKKKAISGAAVLGTAPLPPALGGVCTLPSIILFGED